MKKLLLLLLWIGCTSCQMSKCELEPAFCYSPPKRFVENLSSPFPKLTADERTQDWGKELYLGRSFASQMDFYRAITCFKSALFLVPPGCKERRMEIEYDIFLAYYMAEKYQDAVDTFETGSLFLAPECFPAMNDLLITLYDAYIQIDQTDKAIRVLSLITSRDIELAQNLTIGTNIRNGDISLTLEAAEGSAIQENVDTFLCEYQIQTKSVSQARTLNAILPGAGYYYVGQTKAALTSFVINTLFIAASYQLFHRGYVPAGIIVSSLEAGWYFGGINGAGIAANEYNQRLYEKMGRDVLIDNRLFPIIMIEKGF